MVFALALVVLSIAPPERADALVPRAPGAFAATSTGELWVIERSGGGALLRLTRDGPVEYALPPAARRVE